MGIFIAYLLLVSANNSFNYKNIFLLSIIPALMGLIMMLFVKEKKIASPIKAREPFWKNLKAINIDLKLYLLVTFIFTLGNSSNTFLLLRAKSIGFNDTNVVLLYLIYNLTAACLSIPFGKLSDRIGRKKILVCGYFVFALVYLSFAFTTQSMVLVITFIIYGFYTAMVSGAERAMIAEISPSELKGTMLGLQSTIVGIALLPASIIAGLLWDLIGASAPFI
ncbi:MAG: MFS transporter, partial [Clostridiales bacterium]